ncbi:MAG: phosphoribosylanthranilate isomerase [Deltaproteobacteria bacterium]|nr:phosphoribosylanthranilate isomerase [Deltaproteobacteria bacterium]
MVRVKICGITRVEDALEAARCGADALGFVFYPPSPRSVTPDEAESIIRKLPPYVLRVGVFVNAPLDEMERVAGQCRLDALQLHDTPAWVRRALRARWRIILALSVNQGKMPEMAEHEADALLLDTYVEGLHGGTGQSFDWLAARAITTDIPIILAGGLTPENVAEAVQVAGPYGVDVASGVESHPGVKDAEKVSRFITMAKGVN